MMRRGNTVFEAVDGLYRGWIPTMQQADSCLLHWTGGKLPWLGYCQLVSFFRWSYAEHKCEAQARLAYAEDSRTMKVVVLPQSIEGGMSSEELKNAPLFEKIREDEFRGFDFCGTAHHHCDGGASQSGVDKKDEDNQPGLHITIGKVASASLDLHVRLTFRGHTYEKSDFDLMDWINIPYDVSEMPPPLQCQVFEYCLLNPPAAAFPEVWKERMVKPVAASPFHQIGMQPWRGQASGSEGAVTQSQRAGGAICPTTEERAVAKILAVGSKFKMGVFEFLDVLDTARAAVDDRLAEIEMQQAKEEAEKQDMLDAIAEARTADILQV